MSRVQRKQHALARFPRGVRRRGVWRAGGRVRPRPCEAPARRHCGRGVPRVTQRAEPLPPQGPLVPALMSPAAAASRGWVLSCDGDLGSTF